MELKREFVTRNVAGDTLLIPIGRTTLDMNGMLTLNEAGAFLWEQLPAAENEAALVEAVLAEYDVDRETAEKDVREFTDRLRELGIL